jgi:hypothetical protein
MKMSKQTRTFARQVQVDLLALADADLFQTVHVWVNGGPAGSVSEKTHVALGYMPGVSEPHTCSLSTLSGSEGEGEMQWLAPAPQQLRERLMDMNVQLFVQHVLPLAFQSLHMEHPEWDEGATFNAHLANHLRWRGTKR